MKRLIAMLAAAALVGGPLAMGEALAQGRERDQGGAERGNAGRQMRDLPMRQPEIRQPQTPQMREDRDYRPYPIQSGEPQRTQPQPQPREERRAYAPPPQTYSREEAPSARRGGYLPPEAGGGVVNDLNRYRLRPPPPGYAWVRVNRGFALVSQATGQIFDIVPD